MMIAFITLNSRLALLQFVPKNSRLPQEGLHKDDDCFYYFEQEIITLD